MAYKIGVISDTHGLLRKEVIDSLKGCDRIIHAGDIDNPSVLEKLNQIAVTYAVRGNADESWAKTLPVVNQVEDIGIRVFIIHDKSQIEENIEKYDLIIFGHSHQYEEIAVGRQIWLNPGSCGPCRFFFPITMAMLYVEENGSFHIEKIVIPRGGRKQKGFRTTDEIKEYLPAMLHDMEKGVSAAKLAKKYRITREMSEQIMRLYYTHPGIDVEGIIRRMGNGVEI